MKKLAEIPNVVVVGGGTGTYVCLSALKQYPINLSAVVSMTDSGGSTGKLRDQLGVLPPGDLRQALVALSESPDIWRKLFAYRFDSGDLQGHNFGNIFLSALEKITGLTSEAVEYAERILQTKGKVHPVTFTNCNLCAEYEDGTVVEGESRIDESEHKNSKISRVFLNPSATMNLSAKRALERADYIVFGPGDIHTSILPNLLVEGVADILSYSPAKKILITNLMTRSGQTDGYCASHFIEEVKKYLYPAKLDYVIVNSKKPQKELLDWYFEVDGASFVRDDLGGTYDDAVVLRRDLLSRTKVRQSASDRVKRSLIRHDPDSLGSVLMGVFRL